MSERVIKTEVKLKNPQGDDFQFERRTVSNGAKNLLLIDIAAIGYMLGRKYSDIDDKDDFLQAFRDGLGMSEKELREREEIFLMDMLEECMMEDSRTDGFRS